MRVAIVGAGRVAQALGRLLQDRGVEIQALAARNVESAEAAATFIGTKVKPVLLAQIPAHADHILIAVKDEALNEVAERLAGAGFSSGVAMHTSGNAGLQSLGALARRGTAVGVLHPLQTVPTPELGIDNLPGSYFAVGGDDHAVLWAKNIVKLLAGHLLTVPDEAWPIYHAAAVMASNYQAALVESALELFSLAGICRAAALEALAPIVRTATENILLSGPHNALTGPISRGDVNTVRTHVNSFGGVSAETRDLYVAAGRRTLTIAEQSGLPEAAAHAMKAALGKLID